MVESNRVSGKCRIRMSIEKVCRRVREKGRMSVSTEKWKNPGEYREKVESVRVSKKLSLRVPEKGIMSVRTEKWENRAEYREKVQFVRVSKKCPDEYQKRVELV